MDLGLWARGVLGDLGLPALLPADLVADLVPPSASYVSAGLVDIVADAEHLVGPRPGRTRHGRIAGLRPPHPTPVPTPGVLALVSTRLVLYRADGEAWSAPVESVTDLVAMPGPSGFVLLASDTDDLIVSVQVPVVVSPDVAWRTVPRMTRLFSGWDDELAPYGTKVQW